MISATTIIQTTYGAFTINFHKDDGNERVSFVYGDVTVGEPIIRIHSSCLFGESFHSLHCDCEHQLTETMKAIVENGNGLILYAYEEGRGIGLENKIRAMEIERTSGVDTVEAFRTLGLDADPRNFKIAGDMLKDLRVSKTIKSFSGNPRKRKVLEEAGFIIVKEMEIDGIVLNDIAKKEKSVKQKKMGYTYKND